MTNAIHSTADAFDRMRERAEKAEERHREAAAEAALYLAQWWELCEAAGFTEATDFDDCDGSMRQRNVVAAILRLRGADALAVSLECLRDDWRDRCVAAEVRRAKAAERYGDEIGRLTREGDAWREKYNAASAEVDALAKAIRERDDLRADLASRDAPLEAIERALGDLCSGDGLAADVMRLVENERELREQTATRGAQLVEAIRERDEAQAEHDAELYAQDATIGRLRGALAEALDGWEHRLRRPTSYVDEDLAAIARVRGMLEG